MGKPNLVEFEKKQSSFPMAATINGNKQADTRDLFKQTLVRQGHKKERRRRKRKRRRKKKKKKTQDSFTLRNRLFLPPRNLSLSVTPLLLI